MLPPRSKCRFCSADIFWARTQNGSTMPFDWLPVPREVGTFVMVVGPQDVPAAVSSQRMDADASGLLFYRSHSVTCPQHRSWGVGQRIRGV